MYLYENCYCIEDLLFKDNFYDSYIYVRIDIEPRIDNDWGWNITKIELYNKDGSLHDEFYNPSFTILSSKEQNYIDEKFKNDYDVWLEENPYDMGVGMDLSWDWDQYESDDFYNEELH